MSITYDTMGNPLTDGTWTYTWEHGRQLAAMSDGTTTWIYTYDASGLRSKRTNGTDTYTYVYNGSKLMQMKKGAYTLDFTYDASGNPSTVTLNGATYYYITNLQGDVIEIRSSSGGLVCEYSYDAWGNVVSTTTSSTHAIVQLNPLRYRGYVYDTDTGLYYLQSRYYNPNIGRFLNADALVSTGQGMLGNNMFAYCRNNPVRRIDISGREDVECTDLDGNEFTDDEDFIGGGGTSTDATVGTNTGGGGGNSSTGTPGGGNSNPGTPGGGVNQTGTPTYPVDPNNFNPNGLVKKVYVEPGTGRNGGIIKWEIPGTKSAVFEWNESFSEGPHYHAMKVELGNVHINHLYAGDLIEEPWSQYF